MFSPRSHANLDTPVINAQSSLLYGPVSESGNPTSCAMSVRTNTFIVV